MLHTFIPVGALDLGLDIDWRLDANNVTALLIDNKIILVAARVGALGRHGLSDRQLLHRAVTEVWSA